MSMAKTILGVDIGYDSLKLALVSGRQVRKTAVVPMPGSLVKEGRVVSPETMGELLRNTMRENGIHASRAALALPNETVFVRNITVPQMTSDQLRYNLPFEFRDYITDELKNYAFDYAVISNDAQRDEADDTAEENAGKAMEVMAVAAPLTLIEESRVILRKAGLKMVKAAPALCAYIALIRQLPAEQRSTNHEYCILDLGYNSVRMYMFRGDQHEVTRVLEVGMSTIDDVIADAYNVDVHLAHTYLLSNFDGCQSKDFCVNAFNNIAVELMRALNFYRFSNPDSQLSDIWLCGGGAAIEPLRAAIAASLDLTIHQAEELLPGSRRPEACNALIQAIGITQD